MSLYEDGLRAADAQDSGGHQDVPASRQIQRHRGLAWGRQQQRHMGSCAGSPQDHRYAGSRPSPLGFPDSQWLSLGEVDPQKEQNQAQGPVHVHGGGKMTQGHRPQMSVLLSAPALVCLPWPVLAELISKRMWGGNLHKSNGGGGAVPPFSTKPQLGGWGQLH